VKRVGAVIAEAVLAGCGSSVKTVTRVEQSVERCNGIPADSTFHYAICGGHRFVRDGKSIAIDDPPGALVGHWARACEVPRAFFVAAGGGVPHAVTGEADWTGAPDSVADGWTSDGRAVVELPHGACGSSASRPGVYFISRDGRRTLVAPLPRRR
jgi:hypothetical protein